MGGTGASARGQHLVSDLLLIGRERRVEWFRRGQRFVEARGGDRHHRLPALHALDRRRRGAFLLFGPLGAKLFHARGGLAGLLELHVGEGVPLRFLLGCDLERGLQVSELCFDLLGRRSERAQPVALPLREMPGLGPAFRPRRLGEGLRDGGRKAVCKRQYE